MFLTEFHSAETVQLAKPATDVFDVLVDVDRLPEWNAHVHHVIERPDRALAAGVEWVIQMRAMGTKWPSRSRALTVDRAALSFEHRSCSDDGNPSYALWSWQLTPTPDGSTLTVTWTVHPRSFWRKLILARARRPVLADEVKASLAGLDNYLLNANSAPQTSEGRSTPHAAAIPGRRQRLDDKCRYGQRRSRNLRYLAAVPAITALLLVVGQALTPNGLDRPITTVGIWNPALAANQRISTAWLPRQRHPSPVNTRPRPRSRQRLLTTPTRQSILTV
jgi:uncharacterized protein YndB with AHSA1/START domain